MLFPKVETPIVHLVNRAVFFFSCSVYKTNHTHQHIMNKLWSLQTYHEKQSTLLAREPTNATYTNVWSFQTYAKPVTRLQRKPTQLQRCRRPPVQLQNEKNNNQDKLHDGRCANLTFEDIKNMFSDTELNDDDHATAMHCLDRLNSAAAQNHMAELEQAAKDTANDIADAKTEKKRLAKKAQAAVNAQNAAAAAAAVAAENKAEEEEEAARIAAEQAEAAEKKKQAAAQKAEEEEEAARMGDYSFEFQDESEVDEETVANTENEVIITEQKRTDCDNDSTCDWDETYGPFYGCEQRCEQPIDGVFLNETQCNSKAGCHWDWDLNKENMKCWSSSARDVCPEGEDQTTKSQDQTRDQFDLKAVDYELINAMGMDGKLTGVFNIDENEVGAPKCSTDDDCKTKCQGGMMPEEMCDTLTCDTTTNTCIEPSFSLEDMDFEFEKEEEEKVQEIQDVQDVQDFDELEKCNTKCNDYKDKGQCSTDSTCDWYNEESACHCNIPVSKEEALHNIGLDGEALVSVSKIGDLMGAIKLIGDIKEMEKNILQHAEPECTTNQDCCGESEECNLRCNDGKCDY